LTTKKKGKRMDVPTLSYFSHISPWSIPTGTKIFEARHIQQFEFFPSTLTMLFWLLPLILPATAYTPVIVVETSEVTVAAATTHVVVKTVTSTPTEEPALPTDISGGTLTVSLYPSWLESILATAIPSTWEERLKTDAAFEEAEYERESAGIMPAWYSSMPSDAKYALSSVKAVVSSDIIAWDSSLLAQATEVTTTAGASVVSSSTSVITGVTVSGSQTATSKIAGTSTSTGGATGATGGLVMGMAGAAGILGLALAL
jgi:hypothetical protein